MKKDELISKISQIVNDNLGMEVPTNEPLFSPDYMDSLDMLSIIMEMETKFGIRIPDETVAEMSSRKLSIEEMAEELMETYGF